MKKSTAASVLVLALSVGAAGFAAAAEVSDAWLTTKTKIALMTADGVSATGLNVDTVKGVVTLHGKVTTEGEKAKAEEVAKGIEGVTSVKNLLQVVPASQEKAVDATDDVVKSNLERAWKADKALSESGVSVASVNKGVVLLSGSAKSVEAHLHAIEAARKVAGVKRVSSEVTVSDSSN
jgi:hyperosmotically inducible periplasmic protein